MVKMLEHTLEEIEQERSETLIAIGETNGSPSPGSFYCHEALHMASFLHGSVVQSLMEHPSIANNPEWFKAAHAAANQLWFLYQSIGDAHLVPVKNDD